MDPQTRKTFEAYLASRQKKSALSIIDESFPKQAEFIRDPHKRKTLFCTRRAAKSYTGGLYLAQTARDFPGCNTLYLGLTRLTAKGIIWKDILKTLDQKHKLGMQFNGSDLTATMPNGSMIYVTGVDAQEDEMHKLLGKKWKLVVIDESQAYSVDLRTLVYGVLGPAVVDEGGTICLMGTAGNLTQGLFFDVTQSKEPGWKLFEWSAFDNPYVAKQWQIELDDISANRPLFKETSLFKQWYRNIWTIDEAAKVYRFEEGRNTAPHLPLHLTDWRYIMGLDLAHSPDSTAIVVGAYTLADPCLYIVHTFKETEMDLTAVAQKVKAFDSQYHFDVKITDGSAKQSVAELNNRHGLGLIPADKTGKVDFIKIMNDEFIQGKIKLLPQADPLKEEYNSLIWLTDANGKVEEPRKEHPNIHNDLCDAALYAWRHAYSYLWHPAEKKPDIGSQEHWEPLHIAKLQDQVRKEQNPDELDVNWSEVWEESDFSL